MAGPRADLLLGGAWIKGVRVNKERRMEATDDGDEQSARSYMVDYWEETNTRARAPQLACSVYIDYVYITSLTTHGPMGDQEWGEPNEARAETSSSSRPVVGCL